MRLTWLLLPTVLSLLVAMILACARSSGGGGSGGGGTTPTQNCVDMTGAALLAGTFTVASTFWGAVSPIASCTTCAAGNAAYYPDSGINVPAASDEKAIGGLTCTNLCVCSADGTCYTRSTDNVNVVLYPYCTGGTCAVYAIVVSETDTDGLVPSTGGATVTAASQIDATTLDRLPITSGRYPQITYASCSGCSTVTTCG